MIQNEFLEKYFKNQLSAEENKGVEEWLLNPENKSAILAMIEEGFLSETQVASVVPFEEFWSEINPAPQKAKVILLKEKWFWAACAACVVFLLGGFWFGYHLDTISNSSHQWQVNTSNAASNDFARVTLSDGSKVVLAANSSLSFDPNTTVNPTIYLDGAAYFEFKKSKKSYTIKTKNTITTTKDSKLNISAFSKDSTVKVIVKKGQAELRENMDMIPLVKLIPAKKISPQKVENTAMTMVNANEEATFDKNSKVTNIEKVNPNASPLLKIYLSPKSAKESKLISFTNASIADVTKSLHEKYNLLFELNEVTGSHNTYTGNFNADENPFNILIVVCKKIGLTFKIDGNMIRIVEVK